MTWLYRLLLGRAPDDGARAAVGRQSVRAVCRALLESNEYRGRNAGERA